MSSPCICSAYSMLCGAIFRKLWNILDRALALSPHNPDLYVDKGKILIETGQSEDALFCFDKALAINGRHPVALDLKGSILLLLKRPAETLEIFDRLIQIAPFRSRTLNNRGLALTELGRYEGAIESFRLAAASDPGIRRYGSIWEMSFVSANHTTRPSLHMAMLRRSALISRKPGLVAATRWRP